MNDQSELDRRYFIDGYTYNCPFCNRHSVVYEVTEKISFDWSHNKTAYGFIVRCGGCGKESFHLSFWSLNSDRLTYSFEFKDSDGTLKRFTPDKDKLDGLFFYHQPTSFFTLDKRIPGITRELIAEADGCRKMTYLVGASGALRKGIYKFLKDQKAHEQVDAKGKPLSYEDQVKWVKSQHPLVAEAYFDALGNITDMVSEELHEDKDWEAWTNEEFDYIVATVKAVLHEVYVMPEERKGMLERVLKLGPGKKNEEKPQEKITTSEK